MRQIIQNAIQSPDNTILISRHRHDYQSYTDTITGAEYVVDGGHEYIRTSAYDDQVSLAVYADDDISIKADKMVWGTRGKLGDEPLRYVFLKDCETEHLEKILEQKNIASYMPEIIQYILFAQRMIVKDNPNT